MRRRLRRVVEKFQYWLEDKTNIPIKTARNRMKDRSYKVADIALVR